MALWWRPGLRKNHPSQLRPVLSHKSLFPPPFFSSIHIFIISPWASLRTVKLIVREWWIPLSLAQFWLWWRCVALQTPCWQGSHCHHQASRQEFAVTHLITTVPQLRVILITHQAPLVQQGKLISNTKRFLGQPGQTQVPTFSQTNALTLFPGRAVLWGFYSLNSS